MNTSIAPRFQWRALTSVLIGFAFVLLAVSGVVLFISPPGRVANWTNWSILGLRKSDWAGLHIWFAAVFLAGAALHLFYNLRPMLNYFKDRMTRRVALRREWVVAAVVCGLLAAGTLAKVPPFATLLAWNEDIKGSWEQPAERAPFPHAELLTLSELAAAAGIDFATAAARLTEKNISGIAPDAVVQEIADGAKISARQLYELISTASRRPARQAEGRRSGGGPGWKTLAQFCTDEGLDLATAIAQLQARGYSASETHTLRELAASREVEPFELVTLLRGPAP
jgi:hypothetical protein